MSLKCAALCCPAGDLQSAKAFGTEAVLSHVMSLDFFGAHLSYPSIRCRRKKETMKPMRKTQMKLTRPLMQMMTEKLEMNQQAPQMNLSDLVKVVES